MGFCKFTHIVYDFLPDTQRLNRKKYKLVRATKTCLTLFITLFGGRRDGEREGGRDGVREGWREGGRVGGRDTGMDGGSEGRREGGREGGEPVINGPLLEVTPLAGIKRPIYQASLTSHSTLYRNK